MNNYQANALEKVKSFATEISDVKAAPCELFYVCRYGAWNSNEPIERPCDTDSIRYYYRLSEGDVILYRDTPLTEKEMATIVEGKALRNNIKEISSSSAKPMCYNAFRQPINDHAINLRPTDEEVLEIARKRSLGREKGDLRVKRKWECDELENRCKQRRYEFVCGISEETAHSHFNETLAFFMQAIIALSDNELCGFNRKGIRFSEAYLTMFLSSLYGNENCYTDSNAAQRDYCYATMPYRVLLCTVLSFADTRNHEYIRLEVNKRTQMLDVIHQQNDMLDAVYAFLTKTFGYEMSTEELMLQNGTHQLFTKKR